MAHLVRVTPDARQEDRGKRHVYQNIRKALPKKNKSRDRETENKSERERESKQTLGLRPFHRRATATEWRVPTPPYCPNNRSGRGHGLASSKLKMSLRV